MLIQIIKKYFNEIFFRNKLEADIDILKKLVGTLKVDQNKQKNTQDISEFEFKIHSQFGEDGIIQFILDNINIKKKIFIELGVENYEEANTRFLLENNNWSGLVIDSSKNNINHIKKQGYFWRNDLLAAHAFLSPKNINDIITKHNFNGDIGLLSIDIDGNDYWLLKAIAVVNADIIIIEYNANFGPKKSLTIKYNENFVRAKSGIEKLIYGCSLKAASNLCKEKGYSLICTNKNGNNAFFVKTKLLNDKIKERAVEEVFKLNSFKEYADSSGNISAISLEQIFKIQKSVLVQEV